jgi:peptide/nickel transport system substrate-binding protein
VRDIAAATAIGSRTVRLRLRRPSLGLLDQPFADVPILPRHLWANLPKGRLAPPGPPIGSGPFRLIRHERGRSYRLEAVRGYAHGRAAVERIDLPIIPTIDRAADRLRTGRIDAMLAGDRAEQLASPGVAVARGPSYSGTVLMFNTAVAPFDRLVARRAVADAIDLKRVAAAVAGPAGPGSVPPATRGYVSPESPWASRRTLHRPDVEAARLAFAEQGIGSFTILASGDDPAAVEAARQVAIAVQRAGGRARVDERTPEGLAAAVGQDRSHGRGFQAAIWSTPTLASYDPAFVRAVFGPPGPTSLNYARYASRGFDIAAGRVDAARTPGDRRAAVQAELEVLARELPVVPLFYAGDAWVYRPGVFGGWVFVKGSGLLDKRSLLAHPAVTRRAPGASAADPIDRAGDGSDPLPIALGIIGVLSVILGAALARGRRGR